MDHKAPAHASLFEDQSVLAVDVGGVHTRAALFEVVEGEYRLIASGSAASTAEAPVRDVMSGVRSAIVDLQIVTGRTLLDEQLRLITPSRPNGTGVDIFVSTLSAGPAIRAAVVGLLTDVSLESARRLAETCYLRIVEVLGINDPRQASQKLDMLVRLRPDAVIVAGGVDGGASRSLQRVLEPVGLAGYLLDPEQRPAILFAGNERAQGEVKELFTDVASAVLVSPNVRPSLDIENLGPAARELAALFMSIRRRQLNGLEELETWSGGRVLSTAYAEGRMTRFLGSLAGGPDAAVLGVDLGASAAIVTASSDSSPVLHVYPQYGLGASLAGLLQYATPEEIMRWCPLDVPAQRLVEFLHQKSLYPAAIPATSEDRSLYMAAARQALFLAMQGTPRLRAQNPGEDAGPRTHPKIIVAGGAAFADAASPVEALLLLLDSVQPAGLAQILVDQNHLLAHLGAAAEVNSLLPVQVLNAAPFRTLGTVISLTGHAGEGAPIAGARLVHEDGSEAVMDVRAGNLESLPLATGDSAQLTIRPRHGINAGFGAGRAGTIAVSGGSMGVVLDGRGRPIRLPRDPAHRRDLLMKWAWTLRG